MATGLKMQPGSFAADDDVEASATCAIFVSALCPWGNNKNKHSRGDIDMRGYMCTGASRAEQRD